jgi:signal peptidase I
MYEMQDGKATEITWGGLTKTLLPSHPLFRENPEQIQTLYNLGFEWSNHFKPAPNSLLPSRYVYFRNGDLYLMGGLILKKEDPSLIRFLQREYEAKATSTSVRPYFPFEDIGPPVTADGQIDREFIHKYGITIPKGMYLVMGDNHAMSADSRQFGFVPEANLRGGASFLFWPAGDRWGRLSQSAIAHLTFPNLTVWFLVIGISAWSYRMQRRYLKNSFRKEGESPPFKF